ncbi:unannotated protein [freshwater metagenome]|uniref:Unannotated protein n=1 Tax=freshwater metagenome TaxID=449393 RepID=A0A6J7GM56_9ZZZZ
MRVKSELVSRLQRAGDADADVSRAISEELVAIEKRRRALKEGSLS